MCLLWTYPKFLHTVPKSLEMEMKISVNNHHMITHLTLEDVTFTYIKCKTLLSLSWHYPLVYHKICSYDVMYNVNPSSNMKIHNTLPHFFLLHYLILQHCNGWKVLHLTWYMLHMQMWLSDITNESQNYSLPILAYTTYEYLPTISQYVTL